MVRWERADRTQQRSSPPCMADQQSATNGPWAILLLTGYIVLACHLPIDRWWVELLRFLVPFGLLAGLVAVPLALWRARSWTARLPALALALLLVKPLRETIAFNPGTAEDAQFTVLSYNAALFNPARPSEQTSDSLLYTELYAALRGAHVPDILCLQEFYHGFDLDLEQAVDSIIRLGGYRSFYMNPRYDKDYRGVVGVATFSRHPIIASEPIYRSQGDANQGHWVDVRIGTDTVRVVNFHLRSMSLRWQRGRAPGLLADVWANLRHFHDRLRWGYQQRARQLARIEEHLANAPARRILCGDLNAIPYSATYQRLLRAHRNAFDERGNGLGATYRRFPWLIRIDNQFFSPGLEVVHCTTDRRLLISDHLGVEAGYRITPLP